MTLLQRRAFVLAAACALAACSPQGPQDKSPVGGPFQLVNQDGRVVDESVLNGKWTAVYFGFAYCPDICPTTLAALGEAQSLLRPAEARKFQVVMISIDPERDTPALLRTYLSNPAFPEGMIGLTGSPAQVDGAAKAYRAFYRKVGEGPGYTMSHADIIYLMDPKGRYARVFTQKLPPAEIARQVSEAMRRGA